MKRNSFEETKLLRYFFFCIFDHTMRTSKSHRGQLPFSYFCPSSTSFVFIPRLRPLLVHSLFTIYTYIYIALGENFALGFSAPFTFFSGYIRTFVFAPVQFTRAAPLGVWTTRKCIPNTKSKLPVSAYRFKLTCKRGGSKYYAGTPALPAILLFSYILLVYISTNIYFTNIHTHTAAEPQVTPRPLAFILRAFFFLSTPWEIGLNKISVTFSRVCVRPRRWRRCSEFRLFFRSTFSTARVQAATS